MKAFTTLLILTICTLFWNSAYSQWSNTANPILTSGFPTIQLDQPAMVLDNTGNNDAGSIIWADDGTHIARMAFQSDVRKIQFQSGVIYIPTGTYNTFSIDLDRPIISATEDGFITVGPEGDSRITIDDDDIQRKTATGTDVLYLNHYGGGVNISNGNIVTDDVNNRVGIGTLLPTAKLHLSFLGTDGLYIDGSNTGDARILIENGGGNHFIFDDQSDGHSLDIESAGDLNFNTGGATERMSLSSAGLLIINKANEALRLSGSSSYLSFYNGAIHNAHLWHNNTDMYLLNKVTSGNLYLGAGNGTKMTILSTGNVGVKTTAPLSDLHVKGEQIRLESADTKSLLFFNGSVQEGNLSMLSNGNLRLANTAGGGIFFSSDAQINLNTAAGLTLSASTSGDVGIGTSTPLAKLDVVGDVIMRGTNVECGRDAGAGIANITIGAGRTEDGQASFQLVSDQSSYPDWGVKFARFNNGFSRFTHRGTNAFQFMSEGAANIGFLTNSSLRMTIEHTSGDVGIGISNPTSRLHVAGDIFATGTITSSDRRLKRDIDEYSAGLDEVMKLRPVSYFYNGEAGIRTDLKHVGLIAQELEAIQPELVGEYLYQDKDMWDNVIEEGTYKYIQEGAIKYMLVNAVQQQQEQIEETEVDVDALQAEMAQLKAENQEMKAMLADIQKTLVNLKGQTTQVDLTQTHKKQLKLNGENAVAMLEQNQPNPFRENTLIKYFLPEDASGAQLNIFTTDGKLLKTLKISENGHGQLNITANSLPAGSYTYQLVTDKGIVAYKTMVLQ